MEPEPTLKKLLGQVRDTLRLKHDSVRTEQAYANWIKRSIEFHRKRRPKEMGVPEVWAFLGPPQRRRASPPPG